MGTWTGHEHDTERARLLDLRDALDTIRPPEEWMVRFLMGAVDQLDDILNEWRDGPI